MPLDTREVILDSPRSLVIPGDPDESALVIAISSTDETRMPPSTAGPPLSQDEIRIIRQWIQDGAN